MNDTLLGGSLALGGVFLGGLVSLAVEALRHKWNISDRKYIRQKEIIDRRCDQAETYAQIVTGDFRSLMHDIEVYLSNDPNYAVRRDEARRYWKDHLNTKIFSLGPSIRALSDNALMKPWDFMIEAIEELQKLYRQVWEFRFEDQLLEINNPLELINKIWLDYAQHLGNFYKRLDQIRFELTEE